MGEGRRWLGGLPAYRQSQCESRVECLRARAARLALELLQESQTGAVRHVAWEAGMEHVSIAGTELAPSRIGLGTWAMGGWMWGGTDEERSIRTICAALDRGVTLIDTAPAYGQGRSEEIVGRAVARWGNRERVVIATKVGLEWRHGGDVVRNASRARIQEEITDSLRRL